MATAGATGSSSSPSPATGTVVAAAARGVGAAPSARHVVFRVFIDGGAEVAFGGPCGVFLRGSLAPLSWEKGLPLQQYGHGGTECWGTDIEFASGVPLSEVQFKYTLERPAWGRLEEEAGLNRTLGDARCHFHRWRPGAIYGPAGDPFPVFLLQLISELHSGLLTPSMFLQRFEVLERDGPFNTSRGLAEDTLDLALGHLGMQPSSLPAVFALAGVSGYYEAKRAGTTFQSGWAVKEDPGARAWGDFVLQRVTAWTPAVRLAEVLGPSWWWAVRGVLVATERVYSKRNSFAWLPVFHVLKAHSLAPEVVDASHLQGPEKQKLVDEFERVAKTAIASLDTAGGEETKQAALEWLSALIEYVPSMRALRALLTVETMQVHLLVIRASIVERVRVLDFGYEDKQAFTNLIDEFGELRDHEVAAALLDNKHHPDKYLDEKDTFMLVQKMMGCTLAAQPLVEAARRWARRVHAKEPAPKYEYVQTASSMTNWPFPYGGSSMEPRLIQPTVAENSEALHTALIGWTPLVRLPCFAEGTAQRSLLFELSQGYFLKKRDPELVLRSILALKPASTDEVDPRTLEVCHATARRIVGEQGHERHIWQFLMKERSLLRTELLYIVASLSARSKGTSNIPQEGDEGGEPLPDDSRPTLTDASNAIVAGLDQGMISLVGTLRDADMWIDLIHWGPSPETPLCDLLGELRKKLIIVGDEIEAGAVTLDTLRLLLRNEESFKQLASAAITYLNGPPSLNEWRMALEAFELRLAQANTYVSLFCRSAQLPAGGLEQEVEELQRGFANLRISQVGRVFEGVPAMRWIPWLYGVRGSELFLQLWRQVCGAARTRTPAMVLEWTGQYAEVPGGHEVDLHVDDDGNATAVVKVRLATPAPRRRRPRDEDEDMDEEEEEDDDPEEEEDEEDDLDRIEEYNYEGTIVGNNIHLRRQEGPTEHDEDEEDDDEDDEEDVSPAAAGGEATQMAHELDGVFDGQQISFRALASVAAAPTGEADDEDEADQDVAPAAQAPAPGVLDREWIRTSVRRRTVEALSQEQVVEKTIPEVIGMWEQFSREIRDGTCEVARTREAFTRLSAGQCRRELALLRSTTEVGREGEDWVPVALARVESVRRFSRVQRWLPGLLALHELLLPLLDQGQPPPQQDSGQEESGASREPLVADLQAAVESLRERTEGFCFQEVPEVVAPLEPLLQGLSEQHLDFLAMLSMRGDLVRWLLENKSTDAVNRLLSLVRPCTDEPRLLNALASLMELRTFLSHFLYNAPPYARFSSLLSAVSALEIDEQVQAMLLNVQGAFDAVLELFDKHTTSPGVKAVHELREILRAGEFAFRCTGCEDEQLVCNIGQSGGQETAKLRSDQLAELRRVLLMTEAPLEEEASADESTATKGAFVEGASAETAGLPACIEAFVDRMELVEETQRTIAALYAGGHFDYALGVEVTCLASEPIVETQQRLAAFKKTLSDWEEAIAAARTKLYFLNFFTVHELELLARLLPKICTGGEEAEGAWAETWPLLRLTAPIEEAQARVAVQESKVAEMGSAAEKLQALGELLQVIGSAHPPRQRPLEIELAGAHEQADLLIQRLTSQEVGTSDQPVWVATVEGEQQVLELVLSVYIRRQRLPEAEELLVCNDSTSLEEVTLLLRRFLHAGRFGRGHCLYCVAHVHRLPYSVQCGAVAALRSLLREYGTDHAAVVLFLSGADHQMLPNALGQHRLALAPLPRTALRAAMARMGERYCGRLEVVRSVINGSGKTHHVLGRAHALQEQCGQSVYRRVAVREAVNACTLAETLLNADRRSLARQAEEPLLLHIDLAHILPDTINSLLFQLVVVGIVRAAGCVYHRNDADHIHLEIPSSPEDRTGQELSFCNLLPTIALSVNPDTLEFHSYNFKSDGSLMRTPCNEMIITCQFLTAMDQSKFLPNSENFNMEWEPTLENPSQEDSFKLLKKATCPEGAPPTFALFASFCHFMGAQFSRVVAYPMLDMPTLMALGEGLEALCHVFCELLVRTSADFSLRQVPDRTVIDAVAESVAPPPGALARAISQEYPGQPSLARGISATSDMVGSPPALTRATSAISNASAGIGNAPEDAAGAGRIASAGYVQRFESMINWEHSEHPVVIFYTGPQDDVTGIDVLALNRQVVDRFIDRDMQLLLRENGVRLDKNWNNISHKDAVMMVRSVEGIDCSEMSIADDVFKGHYVLTVDNLLKTLSIQLRLRYGLPVVLMGETGCGKTALVNFIASALDFPLRVLDVHGGITDQDITRFIEDCSREAAALPPGQHVVAFLDEINAANCMALVKGLIIDRFLAGQRLPSNLRIVAAANPYRLRKHAEHEDVALVYEHRDRGGAGIADPLRDLVYRVHPLPESIIDVVHDFGALSEATEELYVNAILRRELPEWAGEEAGAAGVRAGAAGAAGVSSLTSRPELMGAAWGATEGGQQWTSSWYVPSDYEQFLTAFVKLVCASHCFVREVSGGERSVVSLRDVARVSKVFRWFLRHYTQLRDGPTASCNSIEEPGAEYSLQITAQMRPHLRTAVVLSLAFCYHSRLDRQQRQAYCERLCDVWRQLLLRHGGVRWFNLASPEELISVIHSTQAEFVAQMRLGEGIALNEALRENLFMLLVSVMNEIPIFLVGKPGCSKSLAVEILQSNLNGEASDSEFLKALPAVEVFPYQCSPLSTSAGIAGAFAAARRSRLGSARTVVCVLLDEVGLAEESPHLPLKVLHKELEHLEGVACIGISNWALDAAKMSRAVHLYRPPPTVDDLSSTAEGMVASSNLKGYLRSLSSAFFAVYRRQVRADFWGLREFYSTVRVINAALRRQSARAEEEGAMWTPTLEPEVLMDAVLRNFGGRPQEELNAVIEEFFSACGMSARDAPRQGVMDLVRQNLREPDARHLMLLTTNNAALRLLSEHGRLGTTEVMFGSCFPRDQTDAYVAASLQRIKTVMNEPICLVLVHCDSLYEALYDLLNQHYMEYAGQRYVRLAHGTRSKQCPIHIHFRVVVIVEIVDAYHNLAPPLLNRFEKQVLLREHLLRARGRHLLTRIERFMAAMLEDITCGRAAGEDSHKSSSCRAEPWQLVIGFHGQLLHSLALSLQQESESGEESDATDDWARLREAIDRLIWVMMPHTLAALSGGNASTGGTALGTFGVDPAAAYAKQAHADLPTFLDKALLRSQALWCDMQGAQVMLMTHSPPGGEGVRASELTAALDVPVHAVALHEFSSALDMEREIGSFYANHDGPRVLLVHADPGASPVRQIEHCRFVCERKRAERLATMEPMDKQEVGSARLDEGTSVSTATGTTEAPASVTSVALTAESGKDKDIAAVPSGHAKEPHPAEPPCAEVKGVHCVLVVHLPRGSDGVGFSFDFDRRWRFTFLDAVEPAFGGGLPQVTDMLHRPLQDVLRELNFRDVLLSCFRRALAQLVYPGTRSALELRRQIELILEHLRADDFVDACRRHILEMVEQSDVASLELDVTARELELAGTFRGALHGRLVDLVATSFAALLAHLDRNAGLGLLEADRELWFNLAAHSARQLTVYQMGAVQVTRQFRHASGRNAQVEVETDAATKSQSFVSRFPFSFFISRTIDSLRSVIDGVGAVSLPFLARQYEVLKLPLGPEMSESRLQDYLADFTAMRVEFSEALPRSRQAEVLSSLLRSAAGAPLASLLEVHAFYWQEELRVRHLFRLLDIVPKATAATLALLAQGRSASDGGSQLDTAMASAAVDALLLELKETNTDIDAWADRADRCREACTALVGGSAVDAAPSPQLLRLSLLGIFAGTVAAPCGFGANAVADLHLALPADVRTMIALNALLAAAVHVRSAGGFSTSDSSSRLVEVFSDVLEHWALDLALLEGGPAPTDDVIVSLCKVVAGHRLESDDCEVFVTSPALRLALLRKLSALKSEIVATTLRELLAAAALEHGHPDTPLARRFVLVAEEALEASTPAPPTCEEARTWLVSSSGYIAPDDWLRKLAHLRLLCKEYTRHLETASPASSDSASCTEAAEALLACSATSIRSAQLLVLKIIERSQGAAHLRAALLAAPLAGSSWLQSWRAEKEPGLERFLGEGPASLPRWGASADTPHFGAAIEAFTEFSQTGHTARLQALLGDPVCCSGALLAVAETAGLGVLLSSEATPSWHPILLRWLSSEPSLSVGARRLFLLAFAGDEEVMGTLSVSAPSLAAVLHLSPDSPPRAVLLWRVLAHLASVVCSVSDGSPLALFRTLVEQPEGLAGTYLPTMEEDIRGALAEACPENEGGGGWYQCPRGHMYYVDACGRPTEVLTCPECGERIGGLDHQLLDTNRRMQSNDYSPTGYALREESDVTKYQHVRGLPPAAARACRLILHGAMFLRLLIDRCRPADGKGREGAGPPLEETPGLSKSDDDADDKEEAPAAHDSAFAGLINRSLCQMRGDEADYVSRQLERDWALLAELVEDDDTAGMIVHAVLLELATARSSHQNWRALATPQSRAHWEEAVWTTTLQRLVGGEAAKRASHLAELAERWGRDGAAKAGPFLAELREAVDPTLLPADVRATRLPLLWGYRAAASVRALQRAVLSRSSSEVAAQCPVLAAFLRREEKLKPVRHIVAVLRWLEVIYARYNRRIDRDQARQITVREVIEGDPTSAPLFDGFAAAWQAAWAWVERYGCVVVPSNYRQTSMSLDMPISFCLPDEKDEGLCALALTQWLVEQHNSFIEVLAGAGSKIASTAGTATVTVSSRLLGVRDVLDLSADSVLAHAQTHCAMDAPGGGVGYDLSRLERFVRRRCRRKPRIRLELPQFSFLREETASSLRALSARLPQEPLAPDIIRRLRQELRLPATAHQALQVVETCISFLRATGGELQAFDLEARQMLLSDYVEKVLLSKQRLPSETAVAEVRLCHLMSLCSLLEELTDEDPLAVVSVRYKVQLPENLANALRAATSHMELNVLLPAWRSFVLTRLREEYLSAEESLKTALSFVESEGGDLGRFEWFEQAFPSQLRLAHAADGLRLLSEATT